MWEVVTWFLRVLSVLGIAASVILLAWAIITGTYVGIPLALLDLGIWSASLYVSTEEV